jgi:glycerol-3-phosphate dehydrogenase (NAD(P)+)
MNHQEKIAWFIRDQKNIDRVMKNHRNKVYLSSVILEPDRLMMSTDINEVVSWADVLFFCIPSAYFLGVMDRLTVSLDNKFIVSAIKGFVGDKTIAEYFNQTHGIPYDRIGVVSGPCHAEEVGMERLSYLTFTSKHVSSAKALCGFFECSYVRTMPGTDIYGVEYSAALKNIYAIAAGIAHGLGYGDNFLSVLITSSFKEMTDFLNASHPDRKRNVLTSPYLGDLLVTGYSQFSRNRTFGSMIGKGYSVKSAQVEMNMVAEGYYASAAINRINKKYMVDMPIAEAVYEILYEEKSPAYMMKRLSDKLY